MKKNKLKPFLTGSVLILPALLLLNGAGQETKAMMKNAVGKLVGNMKVNKIAIPNVTGGGVKLSSPGLQNAIKRSNSTPNTTTSKFTTPKTNATTSHSFNLGSKPTSFEGTGLKTKRPAPPPPTSNKLTNNNGNVGKPDPGYNTVPKPIFTPKKPGAPQPEPEQYQNVVLVNTDAGTLTIFKDH